MRWILTLGLLTASMPANAAIQVSPCAVVLDSPEASQQLLVTGRHDDGRSIDLSREVRYEILSPPIATIDAAGLVRPRGEGVTVILIRHGPNSVRVPVEVKGLIDSPPVSFEHQVIPVLTKARCNSGGCHGKAEGQNGFKLSVFGFDPAADHAALVKESRGRRVFAASPEHSLLLLKATAAMQHGGGRRIAEGSAHYQWLRRWVAEGSRYTSTAGVTAIRVEPEQALLVPGASQQLRITAVDAAGQRHCVTADAEYESNADPIAHVDARGLIETTTVPGEAAILVRYLGQVAVCRVTVPRPDVKFTRPPVANFIDRLVWDKLERLGIAPSEPATDAVYLRRAYLDTIGTLPTPDEARLFLMNPSPDKRRQLIDKLLDRDEYADYWAMRWADLLRVDREKVTPQGAVAMTRWLRRQFAENRPYDQFVRDILTARGDVHAEKPAAFYLALDTPEEAGRSISQLFLGVRLQCAQCHHHPSDQWGQEDYFGFAGFFTGINRKPLPSGNQAIVLQNGVDLKNPRTGQLMPTRALGIPPADLNGNADRRQSLADWMAASDNPFFARAIANRLWAHYFGRGLVEPIDDLRATNPATNEPLLTELARHLRDVKYDLKAFTRTLLSSRVYQLSATPKPSNASDEQNFSHAAYRALPAEVLLDALCQATGVGEKFNGWPEGYRAIQVWDNRLPSYFFRIFGRPVRASVCECERSNEPSISQALHLMNSPEIMGKIRAPQGRARKLAESKRSPPEIIEELYLTTLARFPSAEEKTLLLEAFAHSDRRTAAEEVLWVLLNSKEFIYNH